MWQDEVMASQKTTSLQPGDESLLRSCLSANQDPDVRIIEREWDEIRDVMAEPWSDFPA